MGNTPSLEGEDKNKYIEEQIRKASVGLDRKNKNIVILFYYLLNKKMKRYKEVK